MGRRQTHTHTHTHTPSYLYFPPRVTHEVSIVSTIIYISFQHVLNRLNRKYDNQYCLGSCKCMLCKKVYFFVKIGHLSYVIKLNGEVEHVEVHREVVPYIFPEEKKTLLS